MALIDSVNHGYGTDAYLHYTLNDIMLQMTQASSPLKVLSFIHIYWLFYWLWVFTEFTIIDLN